MFFSFQLFLKNADLSKLHMIKPLIVLFSETINDPEVKKLLKPVGAGLSLGYGCYSINDIIEEGPFKAAHRGSGLAQTRLNQAIRQKEDYIQNHRIPPHELVFSIMGEKSEFTLKIEACENIILLLKGPSKAIIKIFHFFPLLLY